MKYYRFGTEKINHDLSPKDLLMGLAEFQSECEELKNMRSTYQQEVTASHFLSPFNPGVWSHFARKTCEQRWSWESHRRHKTFFSFLRSREEQIRKGNLTLRNLSSVLYQEGTAALFTGPQVEMNMTEKSRALLHTASCLGNHRASLLLASLHLSGLGHSLHQLKGHIYSLMGALADDRFALMHAGYKHAQGIDGFPKDIDVAYSYYSNIGHQSNIDMGNSHRSSQYSPEPIFLWNHDHLTNRHVFGKDMLDFLKYKAERGDVESQRHLGAMLYWGQNGL
ncbi:hypothetical protein WMY93_024537 [Mugilogobius chulae]|uniref:Uncharacterized protein n=1 Tax=Mugilogobius chulae TaxID=88201 RepID=A0AAW0N4F5_9GOBI